MLIEFSVANYRSIAETQTLSLVAKKDDELKESVCEYTLPGIGDVFFSRACAIYGANASGKSNIFKALRFMRSLVVGSATEIKPDASIDVSRFRLYETKRKEPSFFEVHFVANEVRYRYGLKVDKKKVHSEWLYSFPKGRKRLIFRREYSQKKGGTNYTNGDHYKLDRQLTARTRENALFLSVAAQFNDKQLLEVYNWFQNQLRTLDFSWSAYFGPEASMKIAQDDTSRREYMARMLKMADLGIEDFEVEFLQLEEKDLPTNLPAEIRKKILDEGLPEIRFLHKSDQGELIKFDMFDESGGTQKLFALAGPWTDMVNEGLCVFIDELGANMHPMLTRALIQLLHKSRTSSPCAQLIFTTHDTALLDQSVLRRDQIWFTEKNYDGATELYPLTDYRPRKGEALQKGYLAGRYGAIPFFTGEMVSGSEQ
jgi:uncharacterized protein